MVTLKVKLTANHGGKFSFRICPKTSDLTESCFGSNYLIRVDNGQRDTWVISKDVYDYTMTYQLPATIACPNGCVLQWQYFAMQSCVEPGCNPTYCGAAYASGQNPAVGNSPGFCTATSRPEFFLNCADIIITDSATSPSSPSPLPSPSPSPSPSPKPSPSPSPSPSLDSDPCAGIAPGTARAACLCKGKALGRYQDIALNCQGGYWCYAPGSGAYYSCGTGLRYDVLAGGVCNWASAVTCPGAIQPVVAAAAAAADTGATATVTRVAVTDDEANSAAAAATAITTDVPAVPAEAVVADSTSEAPPSGPAATATAGGGGGAGAGAGAAPVVSAEPVDEAEVGILSPPAVPVPTSPPPVDDIARPNP